jgi:hypothetical protein
MARQQLREGHSIGQLADLDLMKRSFHLSLGSDPGKIEDRPE